MPAKKATAVSKPTYAVMVHESIKSIGDRTGSSVQAITKQLQSQYNIEIINKPALIKAIKKGVENGDLVQIKASYKLGKKTSAAPKPKKPAAAVTTKKKAPAKPRTSSRAKAAVTKPKKTITKKARSTTSTRRSAATTKQTSTKKTTAKRSASTKKKSANK